MAVVRRIRWALVLAGLIAVAAAVAYVRLPQTTNARYVGAEACQSCHRDAYDLWRTSQHRQAMQPADAEAVKGDFNNATLTYAGVVSTFLRNGVGFRVRTDGADGVLAAFDVKYTFGVFPLQQYLIELPGGRLQALSIAWDARPKDVGGQRWFHLYPDEHITHTDELHWTGRQQNWNFMCADCHSTAVRKGYNAATDTFQTTWAEINVACEACHGPGSRHIEWAARPSWLRRMLWRDNGLTVQLSERRGVTWAVNSMIAKPVRSVPRTSSTEIQVCAPCHSRRSQLADGYVPGAPVDDFYEAAVLDAPLYYADGQQRDEVYTSGSFLQSRMQHAGVTCSDCHEPHSARVRRPGNALCTGCHVAARYDAPTHHFHATGSTGSACTSCHMPVRTYMQIDPRRDHSLRVPRPDLSATTGAPNACNDCHTTQTAAWAASNVREWYGHDASGFQDFSEAFHASDQGRPDAISTLIQLASATREPPIVRASALDRLAPSPTRPAVDAALIGLKDPDPMVRRAALHVFDHLAPDTRAALVAPALTDVSRSVRIAAARLLASSSTQLIGDDRTRFDRAAAELVASEQFNADRPEHRLSLGTFLTEAGKLADGVAEYRAALKLAPTFVPAYVNLADAYRLQADEPRAEQTLREGLAHVPSSADLHYALGLSLARSKQLTGATAELKHASDLAPEVARFAYAYALALDGAGQTAAASRVLARYPDDPDARTLADAIRARRR